MEFIKKMLKNDKVLIALFLVLLVAIVFLYRKNIGYSWDKFTMPDVNKLVEKKIEAAKKKTEEVVEAKEVAETKEKEEVAKEEPAGKDAPDAKEAPVPKEEPKKEQKKDTLELCDVSTNCPDNHWCYNNMCVGFASKCAEVDESTEMKPVTNEETTTSALKEGEPSETTITSGALA